MNRFAEPVVYARPVRAVNTFACLLECVASCTETEPTETFTDDAVIAACEDLCRQFQKRVREANDRR